MYRFTVSLTVALTIVFGGVTILEPTADACGVKLGLKRVRPKQKAKIAAATPDRPVVAQRQARTPIAAGPQVIAPRRTIVEAKPREAEAPAVTPAPAPEAVAVAVVPQKETVTATQPAPTKKSAAAKPKRSTKQATPQVAAAEPKPADAAPVVVPSETSTDLGEELYFLPNSWSLRGTSVLDKAVRWAKANPQAKLVVEGHADPRGTPEMNIKVSRERAENVASFLSMNGIDKSRIEVQSFGETKMKYPHGDGNRRVSIHATK
jgi:peptidoglycan-associated lipoprotein